MLDIPVKLGPPPALGAKFGERPSLMNATRRKFLIKVVSIFAMQLAATAVIGFAFFQFKHDLKVIEGKDMIEAHLNAVGVIYSIAFASYWILFCQLTSRRSFDQAAFVFALFSVCMGYFISFNAFSFGFMLADMVLSIVTCAFVAYWARITETDLTRRKIIINLLLIEFVALVVTYALLESGLRFPKGIFPILSHVFDAFFLVIGVAYLAVTFQLIMGGRELELKVEEPIVGALLLRSAYYHDVFGSMSLLYLVGFDKGKALLTHKEGAQNESKSPVDPGSGSASESSATA